MTKISSKQCPGIHWKCNSVDKTMVPRDPTWFRPCKHTFGSCSHITISHVRQHTIHGPSICISHRLYRRIGVPRPMTSVHLLFRSNLPKKVTLPSKCVVLSEYTFGHLFNCRSSLFGGAKT